MKLKPIPIQGWRIEKLSEEVESSQLPPAAPLNSFETTNMLQPFWALPLLAITKLKAKEILPYTLIIMLVGLVVFISSLIVFKF